MDPRNLTEFLAHQRWFAGKGRNWELLGTSPIAVLSDGTPHVRIEAVSVRYADGEVDVYQLAIVRREFPVDTLEHVSLGSEGFPDGRQGWIYDALHDKDVTGLWLRGIAAGARIDGVTFRPSASSPVVPLDAMSLVISAEQSNTSLVFGDVAILKVFRRLSAGLNPDIEIHEALADAGSAHIALPLGSVEGRWSDPVTGQAQTGSLAMLQEFLRNSTEGWESAQASVRDLLAEADLHADEVGGDFAAESERLGVATAEVHRDLARELGTAILEPEGMTAMAEAMRARLRRAAAEVDGLSRHVPPLDAAFADLLTLDHAVTVQRVHGDYHLGQVMRTLDGWKLLDFEGEPVKSLHERRAMDTPIKDIAGMLRSFDYAARHPLVDRPNAPHLEYRANEWSARNRDAFCSGYAGVSGWDPRSESVLLRAFETDKAIYEVVYEARNRPNWLRIPMSAIERLAAAK